MSGMTRSWRITVGPISLASLEGLGGVLAVVEDDVGLAGEHPPDGLADDRLVVDQQDGDLVLGQARARRRSSVGRSGESVGSVADPVGDRPRRSRRGAGPGRRRRARRRPGACPRRRWSPRPGRWCASRPGGAASRPSAPSRPMPVRSDRDARARASAGRRSGRRRRPRAGSAGRPARRRSGAVRDSSRIDVVVGRRQEDLARQRAGRPARPARPAGRSARRASGARPGAKADVDVLDDHHATRPACRAARRGSRPGRSGPPVEAPIATRGHDGRRPSAGPAAAGRPTARDRPRRPADQLADGVDLVEQHPAPRSGRPRGRGSGCRPRRAPRGPSPRRPCRGGR